AHLPLTEAASCRSDCLPLVATLRTAPTPTPTPTPTTSTLTLWPTPCPSSSTPPPWTLEASMTPRSGPAFLQKRNERERQRVKCVNQGYAKLRDHLPGGASEKRLSKVETLRAAIRHIKYLQGLYPPLQGLLTTTSHPEHKDK
uniref:BHLH domain-containing protein n=1 Tax=Hucho hucho TaxID=62062 RepID=A0A4W5MYQ4_9TELE